MIKIRRVKPCPFCGSDFYVKSHKKYLGGNIRSMRIACNGCFFSQVFETQKSEKELSDRAWAIEIKNQLNKRVNHANNT